MARKYNFRAPGKSHEPASMPQDPSTIAPLPFYPNLRRALRSNGAAILLVYLEREHSAPQDDEKGPVLVDVNRTRRDLALPLDTFNRYCSLLSTRFRSATERSAAQRAGREFWRTDGRLRSAVKCYSLTRREDGLYDLRRNVQALRNLLASAKLSWRLAFGGNEAQRTLVVDDAGRGVSQNSVQSGVEMGAVVAENGRAAALEMAKSMAGLSTITDGRRRKGITRTPHHKAPWTPERRARWRATIERKQAAKCQKTRENTLDGLSATSGSDTSTEYREENVLARKPI